MTRVGDPEWKYKEMLKKESHRAYKLFKAQLITWDEYCRRVGRIKELKELS